MAYSIDTAAEELMLEPDEMKEILEAFFEDAPALLGQGKVAVAEGDSGKLARSMHSLKGAAFNMRMDALGELAARAEKGNHLSADILQQIMQGIDTELLSVKQAFDDYYAKNK